MRAAAPLLILCALFSTPELARADGAGVFTFGIGQNSCGSWLAQSATDYEVSVWILGAWSGINFANVDNHTVGSSTDGFGLIGEVKKICTEQPSVPIASAVFQAYRKMAPTK